MSEVETSLRTEAKITASNKADAPPSIDWLAEERASRDVRSLTSPQDSLFGLPQTTTGSKGEWVNTSRTENQEHITEWTEFGKDRLGGNLELNRIQKYADKSLTHLSNSYNSEKHLNGWTFNLFRPDGTLRETQQWREQVRDEKGNEVFPNSFTSIEYAKDGKTKIKQSQTLGNVRVDTVFEPDGITPKRVTDFESNGQSVFRGKRTVHQFEGGLEVEKTVTLDDDGKSVQILNEKYKNSKLVERSYPSTDLSGRQSERFENFTNGKLAGWDEWITIGNGTQLLTNRSQVDGKGRVISQSVIDYAVPGRWGYTPVDASVQPEKFPSDIVPYTNTHTTFDNSVVSRDAHNGATKGHFTLEQTSLLVGRPGRIISSKQPPSRGTSMDGRSR